MEGNDPLNTQQGAADLSSTEAEELFNKAFTESLTGARVSAPAEVVPAAVEATKELEPTPAVEQPPEVVTEKPVEVVEQKKEEEPKPADGDAPKPDDPFAWISTLPDDVKSRVQSVVTERNQFKHQADSDRQRVIALNKKSMSLDRELAALRSKTHKPQANDDTPPAANQRVQDTPPKNRAEWEQLLQADPALAQAIEGRVQDMVEARLKAAIGDFDRTTQERVQQAIAPLEVSQQNVRYNEEMDLLLQQVPNAMEVLQSDQYKHWYANYASPSMRHIAENSIDHRDALDVLYAYSRDLPTVINDLVAQGKMEAPQQAEQATQKQKQEEVPTPKADTTKADQVAKQREQKLNQAPVVQQASTVGIPSAQAPRGSQADLEDPAVIALFEKAFKENLRTR